VEADSLSPEDLGRERGKLEIPTGKKKTTTRENK